MSKALVWNDNLDPSAGVKEHQEGRPLPERAVLGVGWTHSERFKERDYVIPPGESIEMDLEEAIEFKSQFTPIKTDGEKNPLRSSMKKIRIERLGAAATVVPLVCHVTGKVASTPEELAKMNAEHIGQLDADSKKQLDAQAALKAENDALKARLAALEDAVTALKTPAPKARKEA